MGLADGVGVRLGLGVRGQGAIDAGDARGLSSAFAGGDDTGDAGWIGSRGRNHGQSRALALTEQRLYAWLLALGLSQPTAPTSVRHAQWFRLGQSRGVWFLHVRVSRKSGAVAVGLANSGVVVTNDGLLIR